MNKLDVWGKALFGDGEPEGDLPPLSPFLIQMWRRSGRANPGTTDPQEREAFASWYVRHFYQRGGMHWALPPALRDWFNTPAIDVSSQAQAIPGLHGDRANGDCKYITRYMKQVWDAEGQRFDIRSTAGFFDFLSWYAFDYMPKQHIPAALLPTTLVELLNLPAADEQLPLTTGMMVWEKTERPDRYEQLLNGSEARRYAICYEVARQVLSSGNAKLIPPFVSSFWRAMVDSGDTAFDFVTSLVAARNGGSARLPAEIPLGRLFSKTGPADPPVEAAAATRPSPLSIVCYRDQRTVCGLGKAGAYAIEALRSSGLSIIDLDYNIGRKDVKQETFYNAHLFNNSRRSVHVFNLNPEHVLDCAMCNLSRLQKEDYFIGQFYWELSDTCAIHEPTLKLMDEIWAASDFLAGVYRHRVEVPVLTMGTVVAPSPLERSYSRAEFGLREGDYLFLLNFDAGSIVQRKNPYAAVEAFEEAFPRGNEKAGLVIKTRNVTNIGPAGDRKHWERTAKLIEKDRRIKVIDATLPDDAIAGLYAVTDCFVSLHRSEGFGYGPAEALYWGKPVIVTAFSGVSDFCTEATAKLVDYELVTVKPGEYPYVASEGSHFWAQPNPATASRHMRALYEDRQSGMELGKQGQRLMHERYSTAALAERYAVRLKELGFVAADHAA